MTVPDQATQARGPGHRSVVALWQEVALRHPGKTALVATDGSEVSHRELSAAAGGFAAAVRSLTEDLVSSGATPRVGLSLRHGDTVIAAQLGVLAAGCCYVPLDPTYPRARLRRMAGIADLDLVIVDDTGPDDLYRGLRRIDAAQVGPAPLLVADVDPARPAYLLFTSGSTGTPKAVTHTHGSVLASVVGHIANMSLTSGDRVSVLSSFSFDMAVTDSYGALCSGAAAVPIDLRGIGLAETVRTLRRERVSVVHATPTVFRLVVDQLAGQQRGLPNVRVVILGGEPVLVDDVHRARRQCSTDVVLVNGFGFTEASFVLQEHVGPDDPIPSDAVLPVGLPVAGCVVRVLEPDADGAGELEVSGPILAQGYWGDPEQTTARFGADRSRYRPGDRVRRLPDGRFVHAGRTDRQVKVRGVRVELDEVTAAVESLPAVARAGIVQSRDGELAAHIQHATGARARQATDDLRLAVAQLLPDAMVPSQWRSWERLPLTETGKVDLRALRVCDDPQEPTRHLPQPANSREQEVLAAWTETVGTPTGLDVGYFEAGGTSVQLLRLQQAVLAHTGVELSLAALLGAGTVRSIAALLGEQGANAGPRDVRDRMAARAAAQRRRRSRTAGTGV